jgi:hypothetical protein
MSAIIIKADAKSSKILKELAKKLGAEVTSLKDAQYEDVILGAMMDAAKTGEDVSRERVFEKLAKK